MKGIIIKNNDGNEVKIEFRDGYLCFDDTGEVTETVAETKPIKIPQAKKWENNKFFKRISRNVRNNPKKIFEQKTRKKIYKKTGEEIMARQIEALEDGRNSILTVTDSGAVRYIKNRATGGKPRKYKKKKKPTNEPEVEIVDKYDGLARLNQDLNE